MTALNRKFIRENKRRKSSAYAKATRTKTVPTHNAAQSKVSQHPSSSRRINISRRSIAFTSILSAAALAGLAANPLVLAVKSSLCEFVTTGSTLVAPKAAFGSKVISAIATPITETLLSIGSRFSSFTDAPSASLKYSMLTAWGKLGLSDSAGLDIINSATNALNAKAALALKLAEVANSFAAHPIATAACGAVVATSIVGTAYGAFKLAKHLITARKKKDAEQRVDSGRNINWGSRLAWGSTGIALLTSGYLFTKSNNFTNVLAAFTQPKAKVEINIKPLTVVESTIAASAVTTPTASDVVGQSTIPNPWMYPTAQYEEGYADEPTPTIISLTASDHKVRIVPKRFAKLIPQAVFVSLSNETQKKAQKLARKKTNDANTTMQFYKRALNEMKSKDSAKTKYKVIVAASELAVKHGFLKSSSKKDQAPAGHQIMTMRAEAEFNLFKKTGDQNKLKLAFGYAAVSAYLTRDNPTLSPSISKIMKYGQKHAKELLASALSKAPNIVENLPVDPQKWSAGRPELNGKQRVMYIFPVAGNG